MFAFTFVVALMAMLILGTVDAIVEHIGGNRMSKFIDATFKRATRLKRRRAVG